MTPGSTRIPFPLPPTLFSSPLLPPSLPIHSSPFNLPPSPPLLPSHSPLRSLLPYSSSPCFSLLPPSFHFPLLYLCLSPPPFFLLILMPPLFSTPLSSSSYLLSSFSPSLLSFLFHCLIFSFPYHFSSPLYSHSPSTPLTFLPLFLCPVSPLTIHSLFLPFPASPLPLSFLLLHIIPSLFLLPPSFSSLSSSFPTTTRREIISN